MRSFLAVAALAALLIASAPHAGAATVQLGKQGPVLIGTEPGDACRAIVCAPVDHVDVDVVLPIDAGAEPVVGFSLSEVAPFPDAPVHVSCAEDVCGEYAPYVSVADRPLVGGIEAEASASGPSSANDDEARVPATPVEQPARPILAPAAAPPLALSTRSPRPILPWSPAPPAPSPLATAAPGPQPTGARAGEPADLTLAGAGPAVGGPQWSAPERAAAVILLVLALAAYSRVSSRNAALSSPARARIHEILQREGVVALPKLAEELKLGRTTVEHHLRVLERCAVIVVSREGRAVLASLPGLHRQAPPPEVRRSPACQALLAILVTRPEGIPREELHKAAAEIPLRTRNHAIRALAQRGLVVEADGRFVAASKD